MILQAIKRLFSSKEKAYIRQHIPAFVSGFDEEEVQFSSVDELLNIEWVKRFRLLRGKEDPTFYQFSVNKMEGVSSLIAEYDHGYKWFVVGHMYHSNGLVSSLPKWEPKFNKP